MTTTRPLSAAARSVWAKSDRDPVLGVVGWLPLHRHLDDAASVAERLWDEWLPTSVRRAISERLPAAEADGRKLLIWLAGIHDIAKATPAFAIQVPQLTLDMREQGLNVPAELADRKFAPHAMAGQVLLNRWLESRHGWTPHRAAPFAVVVGGHHGVPPDEAELNRAGNHPELLGTGMWQTVQDELLDRAAARCEVADRLPDWHAENLPMTAQALLSAAVIVSDWIASNTELFPYDSADDQTKRTSDAWQQLRFPPPWQATAADPLPAFAARFGLPSNAKPRPLQVEAVRLARETDEPGLLIIEAPMGEGKTEAALLAAEVFAARTGAGGCFVALPTQATSNAMFSRVLTWLRALPDERGDGGTKSVTLAHGKAHLNDEFQGLMRGRFRQIGGDDLNERRRRTKFADQHLLAELVAPQWMSGRKRAGLASFVIGTIDQILFAGLKNRHLALRHLSMVGKVVILDEIHAYDIFMSTYLDRVLEWLGAYQVPTIALSATLPAARRAELVTAYERGRSVARPGLPQIRPSRRERAAGPPAMHPELAGDIGYPVLIASTPTNTAIIREVEAAPRQLDVRIEAVDDELGTLRSILLDALRDGGCAAVVRNTVKRVQETARYLAEQLPDTAIVIAHSRFLGVDRMELERRLLGLFGPDGTARRAEQRYVVVASQVIEQSLDLDFDLLVTDLAPIDLVLQRVGRLHRHQRGTGQSDRAPGLRQARCVLTGTNWTSNPPKPVAGSVAVYHLAPLYRALGVLKPILDGTGRIGLPGAIAPLVQRAYDGDPIGPPEWQPTLKVADDRFNARSLQRKSAAEAFRLDAVKKPGASLLGWLSGGVGDAQEDGPRGIAQVRDGRPGLEALVVQRDQDGGLLTPQWLTRNGGKQIPTEQAVEPYLAKIVAACSLQLPPVMCLPQFVDGVISDLENNYFDGWQQTYLLAGQLVLVLDDTGRARVSDFEVSYDPLYGLEYQHDR